MYQLIVLGNGFDLACGLRSKYSDFFKGRRENERELNLAWLASVKDWPDSKCFEKNDVICRIGWTVWDVILFSSSGKDWCDIESAIKDTITSTPVEDVPGVDSIPALPQRVFSILDGCHEGERRLNYDYAYKRLHFGPPCDPHNMDISVARYCIQSKGLDYFTSVDDVYDFFLQEMHSLEFYFSLYLNRQVQVNRDYMDNARDRIRSLYLKELPPQYRNDDGACTSVLSFNYTRPPVGSVGLGSAQWRNIHGELGKHIIFGIDGADLMPDPHVRPFTKTHRLMELESSEQSANAHTEEIDRPDASTSLIKFYGHSLGEADYSYFQTIFDDVNLYEGRTRLIFYYSPRHNVDSQTARGEMQDKATNLINRYANTDRAHGKYLLHKLVEERRFNVEEYEREPELLGR